MISSAARTEGSQVRTSASLILASSSRDSTRRSCTQAAAPPPGVATPSSCVSCRPTMTISSASLFRVLGSYPQSVLQ